MPINVIGPRGKINLQSQVYPFLSSFFNSLYVLYWFTFPQYVPLHFSSFYDNFYANIYTSRKVPFNFLFLQSISSPERLYSLIYLLNFSKALTLFLSLRFLYLFILRNVVSIISFICFFNAIANFFTTSSSSVMV